ncbi:MAG: DUF4350 domain-containing protein [Blastocatellia bacterium]
MRRYFGVAISIVLVIAVLIALSAAGNLELDRPTETEASPNRSSYNAGPTGARAFYQLLEESNFPVTRWREGYESLQDKAKDATLIVIGPFQFNFGLAELEGRQLRRWIAAGGRLLVISRFPRAQFGDSVIHSRHKENLDGWETPPEQSDRYVDPKSDELIVQPTGLTSDLQDLSFSKFATRMQFYADVAEFDPELPPKPEPAARPSAGDETLSSPTPASSPTTSPQTFPESTPEMAPEEILLGGEETWVDTLYAPVVHLGDKDGAVLADFQYGQGRVMFLSDPFVIANNGISRGANVALALGLIQSLGDGGRRLLFDEYHHGYRNASNQLFSYFRGTPMLWLLLQGGLLSLLLVYTYGRRFARPLPLPQMDRHSPLEFVGSMANLQQAAEARDLALENIYPRFKAKLCRRLGLSSQARIDEIIHRAEQSHLRISGEDLRQVLTVSETVLKGGAPADRFKDGQMIITIAAMRKILLQLKG